MAVAGTLRFMESQQPETPGGERRATGRQPAHEIGKRTYLIADVAPLDVDGRRAVLVGSALWLLGFLALLPFRAQLAESGREWWLWTCAAGLCLGLFSYEYTRRRAAKRAADS